MEKLRKTVNFYVTGFQNMPPWARTLWAIILIKLFIMFVVLRLFFFPRELQNNFDTDEERARHVIENITNP
jgi:Na+/H+ antiporter NhaD/arsenite permease-like protein